MSDQNSEETGSLIGWTMTLWGSVIDPGKARTFVLTDPDTPFPPPPLDDDFPALPDPHPTSTKIYAKPTAHLPGDHGSAEGEANKPAFSDVPSSSMSSTPDEGWFPGINKLVTNSKWVFGAIGIVGLFGISVAGILIWRKRAVIRARRGEYATVAGDEVPMPSMGGSGRNRSLALRGSSRTKELYDAFGEVSDDDDYDDEESGLRRPLADSRKKYNPVFLDDNETSQTADLAYSDDPVARSPLERIDQSSSESASVDGSWVHADGK